MINHKYFLSYKQITNDNKKQDPSLKPESCNMKNRKSILKLYKITLKVLLAVFTRYTVLGLSLIHI